MPTNVTIYATDRLLATIGARKSPKEGSARVIATMAGVYEELVRQGLPVFSANEWSLVADALDGIELDGSGVAPDVGSLIEDRMDLEHLDEKWEVLGDDLTAFRAKLTDLSFARRVAILDFVWRFWSRRRWLLADCVQESAEMTVREIIKQRSNLFPEPAPAKASEG